MVLQVLAMASGAKLGIVGQKNEAGPAGERRPDRDQRLQPHLILGAREAVGEQAERRRVGEVDRIEPAR
jgi:hypothetical protein